MTNFYPIYLHGDSTFPKIITNSRISWRVVENFRKWQQLPLIKLQSLSTMNCKNIANFLFSTARHISQQRHPFLCAVRATNFGLYQNSFIFSKRQYRFSTSKNEEELSQPIPFEQFITSQEILSKLRANNLLTAFPIQEQTFKYIQEGRDVLASDRTGSGKTLAYSLPVFEKFKLAGYNPKTTKLPKFLILCPTRQLTIQVTQQISKFNPGYKIVSLYGGSSVNSSMSDLDRGAAIIVATPGRLIDMINRGSVNLTQLQVVCIDEADTMLQKGFKLDVEKIFHSVKQAVGKTQNIMFSATIPSWVAKIANQYFASNMKRINLIKDEDNRTSQTVDHFAMFVNPADRHKKVIQLIQRFNPQNRTIVFTKTKLQANEFHKQFESSKIVILHGDIEQRQRQHNISQFKRGDRKILIATDVAARGLDIPDVELIIQLSPPQNPEPYIHRSGRTGRAGKEGLNITFFDQSNIHDLLEIEKQANINIKVIKDDFNISLWKDQVTRLVDKVIDYKKKPQDSAFQFFAEQIMKQTSPESALLYLLKEKVGMAPKTISNLTGKKGFISYKVSIQAGQTLNLNQKFPNFVFESITTDADCIKFDINAHDCYKFQKMIELNPELNISLFDENANLTLKQYARQMGSTRSSSSRSNNYRSQGRSGYVRRDDRAGSGNYQRNDRGSSNYQRNDRGSGNYQRNDRGSENHQRNDHRQSRGQEYAGETLSFFLTGFDKEITQAAMTEQIKEQAGISNFKLKLIHKSDENGEKVFGFLNVQNVEDGMKFNQAKINIDGSFLKKRPSRK